MKLQAFTDLLRALLAFQGYQDIEPPKMYVVPHQLLNVMYPEFKDARALHDCKKKTIFMADKFDPSDVLDLATAAYETRRHIQCIEGRILTQCYAQREAEAFKVAVAYLEANNVRVSRELRQKTTRTC